MELIRGGADGFDEPDDGWISGPVLDDKVLLAVSLCIFTGLPVLDPEEFGAAGLCPQRSVGRHPDVDCRQTFLLAKPLLTMGVVDLVSLLSDPPAEMSRPYAWWKEQQS